MDRKKPPACRFHTFFPGVSDPPWIGQEQAIAADIWLCHGWFQYSCQPQKEKVGSFCGWLLCECYRAQGLPQNCGWGSLIHSTKSQGTGIPTSSPFLRFIQLFHSLTSHPTFSKITSKEMAHDSIPTQQVLFPRSQQAVHQFSVQNIIQNPENPSLPISKDISPLFFKTISINQLIPHDKCQPPRYYIVKCNTCICKFCKVDLYIMFYWHYF